MGNPFRTLTKEELKQQEQEKRDIEAKIKAVADNARACLNSDIFLRYRDSVIDAREGIIRLLKTNSEPDPVKFAFFAKACLSKIDAFDMILDLVEKDGKKGVK